MEGRGGEGERHQNPIGSESRLSVKGVEEQKRMGNQVKNLCKSLGKV